MTLPWLERDTPFPPIESAWGPSSEAPGLLAAGADLSTSRLLDAYKHGIFPWFSHGQPILWWSTDPRMVLKVNDFHMRHSFVRVLRKFDADADCEVRIDSAFANVIQHCANTPRAEQAGTWIIEDMQHAYLALHTAGHAHSVETWMNGRLVGGLYCVAIGRAVFGESMFTLASDASKIALAALVALCRHHNVHWIDCQQNTKHLASLGAQEIPRKAFATGLLESTAAPSMDWRWNPLYWNALGFRQARPT